MNLTFTCLNLWMGGKLFDPIVDFLNKQNSDIVALQEAYEKPDHNASNSFNTVTQLNQKLDYPQKEFAAAILDNHADGDILNGNAVLSKLPITLTEISFLSGAFGVRSDAEDPVQIAAAPRNLQHTLIETPAGATVNLFNFQGVWDLDGDNPSQARHDMVTRIMQAAKGLDHVIIAGDTNARPTNPAMQPLEARYTNVFKDELTTTFNMRQKTNPGYASSVVDMVYVSDDIEVLEHTCHNVDISDHLPLSMTFRLL